MIFPHTACMKNILKTIICIGVSALTLVSACACQGGVSDMRRLERRLQRERALQQERIEEQPQDEQLDPNFSVDAEENEAPKDKGEGDERCPDCPEQPEEERKDDKKKEKKDEEERGELLPGRRPPRRGRRKGPKPVPYPMPGDGPTEEDPTDSSF